MSDRETRDLLEAAQKRIQELEAVCSSEQVRQAMGRRITELEQSVVELRRDCRTYGDAMKAERDAVMKVRDEAIATAVVLRVEYDLAKKGLPAEDEMIVKRANYDELVQGLPHTMPEGKKGYSKENVEQLKTFAAVLRRTDSGSNLANSIWALLNHLGES